ncbi:MULTISPECIES: hypothetical protein [Mesorhizobium]|uniref:hypothetical protein n=1 Tax=Mesorhizobium TaxID=68287 RepID=UPI00059B4BFA|nr:MULTISPECIES: hypothetical protein [Mesorhizobium]OBP90001.1 hypothetical protein BAE40_13985 [Mesorhizobium loti]
MVPEEQDCLKRLEQQLLRRHRLEKIIAAKACFVTCNQAFRSRRSFRAFAVHPAHLTEHIEQPLEEGQFLIVQVEENALSSSCSYLDHLFTQWVVVAQFVQLVLKVRALRSDKRDGLLKGDDFALNGLVYGLLYDVVGLQQAFHPRDLPIPSQRQYWEDLLKNQITLWDRNIW